MRSNENSILLKTEIISFVLVRIQFYEKEPTFLISEQLFLLKYYISEFS